MIPYTARDVGAKMARRARSWRRASSIAPSCLQNAFDAAAIAWMARIPERIGYARDGRGVAADAGDRRAASRAKFRRMSASTIWNCCGGRGSSTRLPEERIGHPSGGRGGGAGSGQRRGSAKLGFDGPVIGVSPGSGVRIGQALAAGAVRGGGDSRGEGDWARRCAIFGSEDEREVCAEVDAGCGVRARR